MMEVVLFNDRDDLPKDRGEHALVFTGISAEHDNIVVTYVDFSYVVGGSWVEYRQNSNIVIVRFEDALKWAIEKARDIGVEKIYALFTLDRRIDMHFLRSTFALRIEDKRKTDQTILESTLPAKRPPPWKSFKPSFNSKLKRQRLFA